MHAQTASLLFPFHTLRHVFATFVDGEWVGVGFVGDELAAHVFVHHEAIVVVEGGSGAWFPASKVGYLAIAVLESDSQY